MSRGQLTTALRHLRRLAGAEAEGPSDRLLLQRFAAGRDEAAFAELVRRHGPIVLATCRRVLRHEQDAEDAFQATFLVLARKAAGPGWGPSVGPWLYEVASRLACAARRRAARRRERERRAAVPEARPAPDASLCELAGVVDEELHRLPGPYRQPLLLCCLEGRTRDEAARQLGWSLRTLERRLARGRELLRARLARRGVTLSAALLAAGLARPATALSPLLPAATARAAAAFAAGQGGVSPAAVALAREALRGLTAFRLKAAVALAALLGGLALGAAALGGRAPAEGPRAAPPATEAAERPARTDLFGDLLPPGALARLGTVRFRHKDFVRHAVFSADGKALIAGDASGMTVFWDAATGKELRRFQAHHGSIDALAVSPNGKTLAAAGGRDIRLLDVITGRLVREWKTSQVDVHGLLFSPDGKTLATRAYEPVIGLWDAATGEKRHELKGHRGVVGAFAFSPDGKELASCSWEDNVIRVWDVATGREARQLKGHARNVLAVSWSPDGKTVASTGNDQTMRFWDAATGKERARTAALKDGVPLPIAYLPDGSALVGLHSNYCTLRLYDPATGKVLRSFTPALRSMAQMTIAPDGKWVAVSGGGAHTLELWDTATGQLVGAEGHRQPVTGLAFTADGKTIFSASGTTEYALRVWGAATGKELRRLGWRDGTQGSDALAMSPDGALLAAGTYDGRAFEGVSLRDPATGREVRRLQQPGRIVSVGFSADGRRLASCSWDQAKWSNSIRLWDVATGRAGVRIDTGQMGPPAKDPPTPAALSPDGKVVAAAGHQDGTVRLWDADTGRVLRRFKAGTNSGAVLGFGAALAFSPDGRLLAVRGWREGTGLWEAATGKLLRRLDDAGEGVGAVAFSPDGRTLATGGSAVRLWEVATGQLRATLAGHAGEVSALAFAPDGRSLASGSVDTTILTWGLAGPAVRPTPRQLRALWDDLAGDAAPAYEAIRALAAAPEEAVPFLRERLKPVPPLTAPGRERLARLLADLDSDRFEVRQRAAAEIETLGEVAAPALRKALTASSAEVRRKAEALLAKIDSPSPTPERLRLLRAVEALEHAGTPDARRLLEALTRGAAEAPLTRDARLSLERLARRPAASP
jgi:RNA polymerase sigma factor (sigma-70 family)